MADNTRVNELQEKLLKAIDILNAQALNSISFDKTIICTIENDKDKKDGKYEVNDGNRIFTAYSNDTKLRSGDTVYVTVPEGNFENQKMIIGKKTADNSKPFNFTQPFDTFFDMTGNVAVGAMPIEAVANNEEDKRIAILYEKDEQGNTISLNVSDKDIIKYTRLAIRANFRSWIKNAISGNYGIDIILTTDKPNTTTGETKNGTYTYRFDSSMFYGNPYNFETYYSQELVLDLEKQDIGKVTGIRVDFYQDEPFKDREDVALSSTEQDGGLLASNLFVDNLEIYFGKDISTFTSDMVEIYTKDSLKFMEPQSKNISARWVHLKDGNPIDMIKKPDTNVNYEIRWYKYILGSAAADEYCGVYWDRINPTSGKRLFYKDNKWYEKEFIEAEGVEKDKVVEDLNTKSFACKFTPDCKKNQEKIKCIVLVDNNIPYRSNEILFENEKEVVDTSIQTFVNALQIEEDDNTNGNYMIYGQNNNLLDSEDTKIVRTLSVYFDTNGDGEAESLVQPNDNLQWIFPNNSMIILQNGDPLLDEEGNEQKDESGNIIRSNIVTKNQPQYKIASYYSPGKSNNTIQCIYTNNGIIYTTEKEFTFGPSGTMGTDQTIVIDFVGDTKALLVGTETFQLQVQVYDNKNKLLLDMPENITWSWLYPTSNSCLKIPNKTIIEDIEQSHPAIIDIQVLEGFSINQLYIIQVEVGNLTTYFPIPIKASEEYSYITGATQVIYQSDGEPNYSKEKYELFKIDGSKIENIGWKIFPSEESHTYQKVTFNDSKEYEIGKYYIYNDEKEKYEISNESYNNKIIYYQQIENTYIGSLNSYTDGYVLEPLSIYVKDAPIYGIQTLDSNGKTLWTQPVLILQNKWSSNIINKWDGKSLQLDEENSAVIAAAISAGRKNSEDNTFSGVMIGDWSNSKLDTNSSIAKQTGVYGFHHGAMSYAFKEDGTAFLGKDGRGRICFDGNDATIYSADYSTNNIGIKIDLNDPYIIINKGSELSSTSAYPFQIGSNFKVEWSGNITATGGTIGGWTINSTSLSKGGISLNSETETISGGTINGATIKAGTLMSNDVNNYINLSGYLKVNDTSGRIGYLQSNLPLDQNQLEEDKKGIGMEYLKDDSTVGEIKVTGVNTGMKYGGCFISISKDGITIGDGSDTSTAKLDFGGFSPSQQKGIYARFA